MAEHRLIHTLHQDGAEVSRYEHDLPPGKTLIGDEHEFEVSVGNLKSRLVSKIVIEPPLPIPDPETGEPRG